MKLENEIVDFCFFLALCCKFVDSLEKMSSMKCFQCADLSKKCLEELPDHKPAGSGFYPYLVLTIKQNQECHDECDEIKDDMCCFFKCGIIIMDIYPNQTFSEENFRRSFETYFDY